MKKIAITNNNIDESCIADCKSYIPCHVLNMPVVKVGTAKCSTAPKSESVSIEIKAKPAIIAGLMVGNETRKNLWNRFRPKVSADSRMDFDWFKNEILVRRYT